MVVALTPHMKIQREMIEQGIKVCLQRVQGQLCTFEITSSLVENLTGKWALLFMRIVFFSFQYWIDVLFDVELRQGILREAHATPYLIHPGTIKRYKDLSIFFFWNNMKKDKTKVFDLSTNQDCASKTSCVLETSSYYE